MTGRAWGKLILMGEHAAVHGYPALGLTLDLETQVTYTPGTGSDWDLETIPWEHQAQLQKVLNTLAQAYPLIPGKIAIASQVPLGSGFGSSGALCTALVQALAPRIPPEHLWAASHRAEHTFHGRPSGIDTGLAQEQGLWAFQTTPQALPGSLPQRWPLPGFPINLVTASLPRQSSTQTLVAQVHQRLQAHEIETTQRIHALGLLAQETLELFRNPGPESLTAWIPRIQEAQTHLAALGLSTPDLDRILTWAPAQGSLAGKISGAGAGGAFFLLASGPLEARALARALQTFCLAQSIPLSSPVLAYQWTPGTLQRLY